MGSLIELHELTKTKEKLYEAYIQIYTGLTSVDRIISCRINGASFQVKIEEIKCMDKEFHLRRSEKGDSDEETTCVAEGDEWDAASIEAVLEKASESNSDGEETAEGGGGNLNSTREGEKSRVESSNIQKAAEDNHVSYWSQSSMERTTAHDLVGSEVRGGGEVIGPGPETHNSLEVSGPEQSKGLGKDYGNNSMGQRILSPVVGRPFFGPGSGEERTDLGQLGAAKLRTVRKRGGGSRMGRGKLRNREFNPREWEEFIEDMGSEGEKGMYATKSKKGKEKERPRPRGSNEEHLTQECREFGRKLGLKWEGQSEGSGEKDDKGVEGNGRLGDDGKQIL